MTTGGAVGRGNKCKSWPDDERVSAVFILSAYVIRGGRLSQCRGGGEEINDCHPKRLPFCAINQDYINRGLSVVRVTTVNEGFVIQGPLYGVI